MSQKKYASLATLQTFLDNIKAFFVKKTDLETALAGYDTKGSAAAVQENLNVVSDTLTSHSNNADIHVTTTNKSNWMSAYTHSTSAHARTDATNVADSTTNGNILINGTETNVYSHPNSGVTAGTYKSVTVNAQGHVTAGSNPTTLSGFGITDAETKTDAASKLTEAKQYADNAATTVKNDLLNGAGAAYDTLKELGDLITENTDAIDALETVATGKADKVHSHAISEVTDLQTTLDTIQESIDSIPQSDWNQSDSAQLDYIKNRTHWSKSESAILVDEEASLHNGVYYFTTPFPLNIGQTYTVAFDGTTYECVAFNDSGNYNRATIGGSYGDYSTYPFSIFVMSSSYTGIRTGDTAVHTVKVTTVNEIVQKLDEKYIPDTYAKVDYVEDTITEVEDVLSNKIDTKANSSDIANGFVVNVSATLNSSGWDGVVYGDGKYVAVNSTNFAYSTDGINWTHGTLPISAAGIAYGNGMYCAYGYSDTNVCYSTDGIDWNTASTNYSSNKFSIHFLNGKFFISAGYAILSSSDCVTWSKFELGESCTLYGGAYGNGVYIMSGYGDTFISTDGANWSKITTLSTTENYGSILFVDGKFIAIAHGTTDYGSSNKIAYSTNGTTWTYGTLPITTKWVRAKYCNGTIMAAGISGIIYSNDGVNWTMGSLPDGWSTIDTMGSGNEFLLFRNSEVAIARKNPYDLVFKADTNWTQIYDSGEITEAVNAFANINIAGYKKLMVVVKCVNDGTNSPSKHGGVTFTATNGTLYQFNLWSTLFTNAAYTSGAMATFEISDGWLICPNATRILKSSNFLGTEGGVADNLNNTGSGIMRCTNALSTMMIHNTDNDSNYYFLAGSRVIVWGCQA